MLNAVRIVLVEPTHPGNIGAAARAMKTMGLSQLVLVNPVSFPHQAATSRAAGADDVLQHAQVVNSLAEALENVVLVFGTSARPRSLEWPLCSPRECATQVLSHSKGGVALVFGREHAGLTNEELALCHVKVQVATDPEFSSLNLAAAVQILCYELRMAWLESGAGPVEAVPESIELASADELMGFINHLEQTLIRIKVLNPDHPKMLMRRLQRLFYRTRLEKTEVNILRGILKAMAD